MILNSMIFPRFSDILKWCRHTHTYGVTDHPPSWQERQHTSTREHLSEQYFQKESSRKCVLLFLIKQTDRRVDG